MNFEYELVEFGKISKDLWQQELQKALIMCANLFNVNVLVIVQCVRTYISRSTMDRHVHVKITFIMIIKITRVMSSDRVGRLILKVTSIFILM